MTKLATWLEQRGITDEEFGKTIGVHEKSVWRYRRGDRIPDWDVIDRIDEATNHEVTANDWLGVVRSRRPDKRTKNTPSSKAA